MSAQAETHHLISPLAHVVRRRGGLIIRCIIFKVDGPMTMGGWGAYNHNFMVSQKSCIFSVYT